MMGHWAGDGLGWISMGLMWLWMLLPVILVVGAGWLLAAALGGRDRRRAGDMETVLRRRLEAGEIDPEEYRRARLALGLTESEPPGRGAGSG